MQYINSILKTLIVIAILGNSFSCSTKPSKDNDETNSAQTGRDFKDWNGKFINYQSGSGIRLEGNGSTLKAFDASDETPVEVKLMPDGKVIINGGEAFVSNDTLSIVLNGSGGKSEFIYVRVQSDMH